MIWSMIYDLCIVRATLCECVLLIPRTILIAESQTQLLYAHDLISFPSVNNHPGINSSSIIYFHEFQSIFCTNCFRTKILYTFTACYRFTLIARLMCVWLCVCSILLFFCFSHAFICLVGRYKFLPQSIIVRFDRTTA